MKWYLQVLRKYATFRGRASREEFWMFVLLETCFLGVWTAIAIWTGLIREIGFLIAELVYGLLTVCPRLALIWRRFHDMNRSGLNFFWAGIPLIGPFILLIMMAASGTKGENNFGLDPLESEVDQKV
ncbi:DUF805 domain-containing protein [Pseudomonas sp. B21-040]|uniref:DUF805 domain-containing protein n=1 Tax=unclassified Pseudomonas TaxID=196821 RepID=UPI001CBB9AED|nr:MULTISPECIES: DUF805 domain-containing protein [unclassified Pseudomonas]UVL42030.1 DUF805 domain-containing protein [Pseudomonas sp. B21-040]